MFSLKKSNLLDNINPINVADDISDKIESTTDSLKDIPNDVSENISNQDIVNNITNELESKLNLNQWVKDKQNEITSQMENVIPENLKEIKVNLLWW